MTDKTDVCHSRISNRNLPRSNHLVTMNETANRTVTNCDQETLATDSRMTQDILNGSCQINTFGFKLRQVLFNVFNRAMHSGSFT